MERLTKRDFVFNSHYVANKLQSWSIAQCLKKLQEYENAEEDGRLLVLPCELGAKIYMIVTKRPKITAPEYSFIKTTYMKESNLFRVAKDFGKTVFLTHEEAEEALAKMKEGE